MFASAIPGVRLVNFGHLGDGNLHYNVQAPGRRQRWFLRDWEERVNTIVFDLVREFSGSISAGHGVGTLKIDKLLDHKSPGGAGDDACHQARLDPEHHESGTGDSRLNRH